MEDNTTNLVITLASGEKFLLYKENVEDTIWWADELDENGELVVELGPMYFSLDGKKVYNYWSDYPFNMTEAEVELFNRASPFWAEFRNYGKG